MLREIVESSKIPFEVGVEYKIWQTDDPDYEPNIAYGKYVKTGKGRLSPNKGKDVYKFKATRDADAYIKGEFHVGFWEIEAGFTAFEKVGK